jgi:Bacterial Ig domain/Secretion system C-terminal sorting domain
MRQTKSAIKSIQITCITAMLFVLVSTSASAQLGVYAFTGAGTCPNQNPNVTAQPANATFSSMSTVNATCKVVANVYSYTGWNLTGTIDLTEYNQFSITPAAGYVLNLTSLSFTHRVSTNGSGTGTGLTAWILRSSLDNYATNIATGLTQTVNQTPSIILPAAFNNTAAVTFRLYLTLTRDAATSFDIDNVTLNGSVLLPPAAPGNPTSNSPQCSNPGVTLTATGTVPVGETWYWQTTATGTSTANSASTNIVTSSGTYYIRSRNNSTLLWSVGAGSVIATVTPDVTVPVFTLGASSARCDTAQTKTYTATAGNTTGITYSLDAASITAGNTIDALTGAVTYIAGWSNPTIITASAAGCNGPQTATHTVTIAPSVGVPVFTLGASSVTCQGASVTYTATAANSSGITYSLDAASITGGNTINVTTGAVTYAMGWAGPSIITATAVGCGTPQTTTHTVTFNPNVTTPVFTLGATSARCQGAGVVNYSATATNTTGITYSLNAAALAGGNIINAATGDVTYAAGWAGATIITATAAGCNPQSATHTVTITPTVGTPVFTLGATSTRCEGSNTVTYTATATNNTGITYSLDAASIAGGVTINSATGAVTYILGWSGTTTITATATGCNGPRTASHTVTNTPTVGTPVFTLGASSFRCLGAGTITYGATATNTTGITYSLDGVSLLGGNSINTATGAVTFSALWVGTSTITATAAGCNGTKTAIHTVTINAAVSTPNFVLGSTSSRCQGAGTVTYTAAAANTSGITYSLDAASLAGGNTIISTTGDVTYAAGWSGTTVITVSAAGCNGPKTATHTVTVNGFVGTPVFTLGATSARCQAASIVTYTATAANAGSISYSLDATSIAGGNAISASTGAVTYAAGWVGTSTITATASGCSGPRTSTHTVTTNPTVGTPVFTLGATSTRCQAAATVTYTATAANATGITYSLDAASIAGGNSINPSTGAVTYAAAWFGTTTITVSAAGCGGPKTATHTVTTSATVGTPVFALGFSSSRMQGAATITYSATATYTTGITYSLDAASLAAGNTINPTTGTVTYTTMWNGTTIITASAAGCGGPRTATHTVNINSSIVVKQLYLSDPSQALDRVDPVATNDNTTANTPLLSTAGTASTTFTMNPVLCDSLKIKSGTITVRTYLTISSGTMPANPAITAVLSYGGNNIITLNNPTYNSGILTWTATLGSDVTVPAGQAISLQITTALAGVTFRIDFDSQTKPSKIDLPVSSYINVLSTGVYTAAYPGGTQVISGVPSTIKYIRATVTDPFGSSDITALNVTITPSGSTFPAASVATSGCTRTFEYVWNTPAAGGNYIITATAKEGYENTVSNSMNANYNICSTCAPVAMNDSTNGAGGDPIVVDVLANDYDPNNNINPASLTIVGQPHNGSAYISNNTIIYLPNGTYQGEDTITYQICDLSGLCATAKVFLTIDALIVDICADATKTHTYYIPYPENDAYDALVASGSPAMPSNNLRTVISIKIPYAGMTIVWDEWEDGYEANALNPVQTTTKVWGDGNPYNGIAPGYASDIIPANGNIILDNTMNANPRNPASIFYDGKDKVTSNGQLAVTQVTGEPSIMSVQAIKTNVTSTYDFGQSFTIPLGEDFPSRDFRYTALFIRASQNNTVINIDKDNNGTLETTATLNEGQSYLVNGGVMTGATVTSNKPVGVELNAGGVDNYSIRNAPIYPATWYSDTYYTPVPTSDNAADIPKDSSAVMFYNSLNRSININWYSGAPGSGVIAVPAKSAVRFPLAYSTTASYKFVNPTGESFTAIEMVGSYSPGGGGAAGTAYDWAFNLISEDRLTDYTTVAWAPGGLDLNSDGLPDVNGNPIWVTPTANTIIYVKYDGNVNGTTGTLSPCGLRYDVAYNVNALNYIKIKDTDNDQGGIAIFTCNNAKIAAVYGEDPTGSTAGNSSYWDVGTTLQPFCKQKLVVASDDFASTLVNQPVTITILDNDFGFTATIDPSSVSTLGMLQPLHGTVSINSNGTILYTPNPGFSGLDTFEYRVCSTPSPIVCDDATVIVKISTCPSNGNQNVISGQVFIDRNKDAVNNDGGLGLPNIKVYLYTDGNCSGTINANELTDSVMVDTSGYYQFVKYPEKTVADDFKNTSGGTTCNAGSDGDSPWNSNWSDAGDGSNGFCQGVANADVEMTRDGAFGFGLRIKDNDVSARRSINLNGAVKAFLTFSYRRKSNTLIAGEDVLVQASADGTNFSTIYTIAGDGTADANYVTVYNQDISSFANTNSAIRFLTNTNVDDGDTVYIGNVSIKYLKYPQCYITAVASSSVPSYYTMTTVSSKTMTINSGGSCTSNFDFGLAKANITISGTLFNDKNGLMNGIVDGTAVGSPGGTTVYAYLLDYQDLVAFKTTVNSSNGTYSFPLAEVLTDYTLLLSTSNVVLGSPAPATGGWATTWISVGDAFGTNNLSGTGNEPGTPNTSIAVKSGITNVTNVNFGIQRLPNSDSYLTSINHPGINQLITLNGGMNPPVLSGSDPEDCVSGCVLTTKSVTIDQVPVNAELYYNGSLVTNGFTITSFNPALFNLRITAAAIGDSTVTFSYSYVDAAMMKDPTPATYTLIWLVPLPADRLTAVANLNGTVAAIKWSTLSEQNTKYFTVERSFDNSNWLATGSTVPAAGNSTSKTDYQMPDNIADLMQKKIIYYRVKLTDIDGKTTYSNVVAVRLSQKLQITAWPNPFQTSITINMSTDKATTFNIKLMDLSGKIIRNMSHAAAKGVSQVTLRDVERLPAGIYMLEVADENTANRTVQKFVKN